MTSRTVFSATAKTLGVKRGHVSRVVGQLEAQIGTALFWRSTRELCLTRAGAKLLESTRPGLALIGEGITATRRMTTQMEGKIRLSVSGAFGLRYIVPVADAFLNAQPGVGVELVFSEALDSLVRSDLDLVVRIGTMPDSAMVCRRLGELEIVLAVPRVLAEAQGVPQTLEALDALPAVDFIVPGTQRVYAWAFGLGGDTVQFVPSRVALTSSAVEMTAAAVAAGKCVAPLPRYMVEPLLERGQVLVGMERYTIPTVPVSVCFSDPKRLSSKVRAFVDALAAALPRDL